MDWVATLRQALAAGQGVRLGEASVLSRRVHTVDPARPAIISVLTGQDAGQTFYGRSRPDEVIHLDLFHQVGEVDHRQVAAAVVRTLTAAGLGDRSGYFDVQTGTGGGRVTGDLVYGRKPSLLSSHRNHIHLAGLLDDGELPVLLPLVAALEEVVLSHGLEIRKVEGLLHPPPGSGSPLDLSPYADHTDSWLRGTGAGIRGGLRAAGGHGGGGGVRGPVPADPPAPLGEDDEERLQAALRLARKLGSPDELKRVLDAIRDGRAGGTAGGLLGSGNTQVPYLLRELEEEGLIQRDGRGVRFTAEGRMLAGCFDRHLRELKLRFRKLIRRVPHRIVAARTRAGEPPSPSVRYGPVRGVAPAPAGLRLGDVAVPETVLAAVRRAFREGGAAGASRFRLRREDVHVYLRAGEKPLYVCLLIDASASMAGRRIQAAKHLVRHLLVSTHDRVAVVGFQERDVRVYVPFTRDWSLMEEGLSRIQPMGLTPLAHGLTASLELIQAARVRRPLLLLITDGIPTVPKWTIDPLADALEAARRVGQSRVPFGCIGLMPSRRYLEELARAAGGTLHVVDELQEDTLVAIAHRERFRQLQRR